MNIFCKLYFTLGVDNKITESFYKLGWKDCFSQDIFCLFVCFPVYKSLKSWTIVDPRILLALLQLRTRNFFCVYGHLDANKRKPDHVERFVHVDSAHSVMMSYSALKNTGYCYFVFMDSILVKGDSNSNYIDSVHKTYYFVLCCQLLNPTCIYTMVKTLEIISLTVF